MEISAALGPPDASEQSEEPPFLPGDPGITMLPLDEAILDYGALPSVKPTLSNISRMYTQLKSSLRISEKSPLRRRFVVGSRVRRHVGEEFDLVLMFDGIVASVNRDTESSAVRHQSIGDNSMAAGEAGIHPNVPVATAEHGSQILKSEERESSQVTHDAQHSEWCPIVPCQEWPSTSVVTPCFGNIHRLEPAGDFVMILDVMAPSYESPRSREGQYVMPYGMKRPITTHPTNTSATLNRKQEGLMAPNTKSSNYYRGVIWSEEAAGPEVFIEFDPNPS